ncbi:MAG TPA: lipopolysaccharide transport periplasmic protein LptA [Rhodocyclaceae bacterium]|nr:lipopolysaccharide transport periplasmic protein LptA [Rhodocyclaceae bacterium]
MMSKKLFVLFALLASLGSAHAEKADSNKPVNLEADRITVDDVNKVHVFEGNVVLTKGTMVIKTDKLVVTQDANGFQKGVAYGGAGGLARFRQKREGRNEYMEGEGERIEHDDRAEKTDFYTRAYLKSGQDEVRGQFISYDARAENYVVTNGNRSTKPGESNKGERVRAVIQPKNKTDDSQDTAPGSAPLRSNTNTK